MMSSEWKRYNHTCEEYDEGEELASPFLRFCPIGVKVIQAEYIQKNDLVVLHHCSYFRAASTSLEDTTEWVRYFNKIHTKKIRNRASHFKIA